MSFQAVRYPEWKTLYDAILPLIQNGQADFTYDQLGEMALIDVRSGRGRQQFYRFRRELLKTHQIWLENLSGAGYAVIAPKDHTGSAKKRVEYARHKVSQAKAIVRNVRMEELTPDQRLISAAYSALLGQLSKTFHDVGDKLELASGIKDGVLPVDLAQLIESTAPRSKKKSAQENGSGNVPVNLTKLIESADRSRKK
jgi:hypothetical protein